MIERAGFLTLDLARMGRKPDPSKKIIVSCDTCGKSFQKWRDRAKSRRHYCSKECQISHRSGADNPNWRGGHKAVSCKYCKTKFSIEPGSSKIYCNMRCKGLDGRHTKSQLTAARRKIEIRRDRRERLARTTGSHTQEEWAVKITEHDFKCARCGVPGLGKLTKDHITPISKDGTDCIDNIQPLCVPCNSWKGNRMKDGFGILTLDLALNVGWAMEEKFGEKPSLGSQSFHSKKKDHGYRFCCFIDWFADFLDEKNPEIVVYESPFMTARAGNAETLEVLMGFAACVKVMTCRYDIPVFKMAPATARKFFCNTGRAKKENVVAECEARGWSPSNHDEADAAALLATAVSLFRPKRYSYGVPRLVVPKLVPDNPQSGIGLALPSKVRSAA